MTTETKKLNDIIAVIEFPTADMLTDMKSDTMYEYINHTYCIGFGNLLEHQSAYMIARYSLEDRFDVNQTASMPDDDERLKPYFENIESLTKISDDDWYHTYYGEYCDDDVIITGECDRNYYCVWLDKDVSDCCIMKVSKEHYETLEEFNEAVVEYFEKELTYKIRPIRKPRGWFKW